MRFILLAIFITLPYAMQAQCKVDSLRTDMKQAKAKMAGDEYATYLQHKADLSMVERDACKTAVLNEALGSYYFDRDADKSIEYRRIAAEEYYRAGDTVRGNFCLQNIGFIYEERKHDIPNARKYVEKALIGWKKLNDTTQQANLNKYLGYLEGKAGNYINGKRLVRKAISQFKSVNDENGVAVSYFDMARVFMAQHKPDSAIRYLNKANEHWKKVSNADRMFGVNNYLMSNYFLKKDITRMADAYKNNTALLSEKIYWQDKLKFYHFAWHYAELSKEPALEKQYHVRYDMLKDSLKKAGINVD